MYHSSYLVFVPVFFFTYLLTLPPTILWRDTPEFANVAFTLSIAHPAGFPTYSLVVKSLTFLPFGSIAFRTNLASAIFALLSFVLLLVTVRRFIERVYPSAPSSDIQISCAVASLLFALGPIVWYNATITEVYTLNTLFIAGLIYLILLWLEKFDPRWLFLSAFLYGLSAGNHATVALFLPGLSALYFIKRPRSNSSEWIKAIFFFLLGLSVYLSLPVRSLASPPYDWGDPQNLKNFLYQISDQKDFVAGDVLPKGSEVSFFNPLFGHLRLVAHQFSPVGIALIMLGMIQVWMWRQEKGLSFFFLWIIFSNHAFFWSWTSGDAFLPSYLILAFYLGLGTFALLGITRKWSPVTSSRLRGLIGIGLAGLVLIHGFFSFLKVNKRDYYLPSDFFRSAFTSLSPASVLVTEFQWFPIRYFQDIERLRQDISVLSLSEITQPRAFHYITPQRFPYLIIPTVQQAHQNTLRFVNQLVIQNHQAGHPIFRELTERLNQYMNFPIRPHQDFIFQVSLEQRQPEQTAIYFNRMKEKLLNVMKLQQNGYDPDLHLYLDHYIGTLARYLYDRRNSDKAVFLLRAYLQMYGPGESGSISDKNPSILYNSLGLYELHTGQTLNGLKSLELAIKLDPKNRSPYLNLMLWYMEKAPARLGEVLERARRNGLNPEEICATLADYLFKERLINQGKQALVLCRG